ncbi:MAG: hypothetical protein IPO31_10375 [Candidatus Obscuribacter sp.]|nr:hypothetical protein [Candidatus Obscuribacter sp.]
MPDSEPSYEPITLTKEVITLNCYLWETDLLTIVFSPPQIVCLQRRRRDYQSDAGAGKSNAAINRYFNWLRSNTAENQNGTIELK